MMMFAQLLKLSWAVGFLALVTYFWGWELLALQLGFGVVTMVIDKWISSLQEGGYK